MGIETDADRAVFLDPDEFGVSAHLDAEPVEGVLDRDYVETGRTEGYAPVFTCAGGLDADGNKYVLTTAGQHIEIRNSQALYVGQQKFLVREFHPDGTGLAMLVLEAQ